MSQFVYVSYTHRYTCPLFLHIHGRVVRKDEWICVQIDLNFIDNSLLVITMFIEYKLFSRYQFNSWKSTILMSLFKIMRATTSLWSWGFCSSQRWVNQLYTVREWIAESPISVFVTQSIGSGPLHHSDFERRWLRLLDNSAIEWMKFRGSTVYI